MIECNQCTETISNHHYLKECVENQDVTAFEFKEIK